MPSHPERVRRNYAEGRIGALQVATFGPRPMVRGSWLGAGQLDRAMGSLHAHYERLAYGGRVEQEQRTGDEPV